MVFEIAIMIGTHPPQKELFSYRINLNQRVRDNHPLRQIREVVDFDFVRAEVAPLYGYNGNESVPPETILKMMFLLFYDDIASERELMHVIAERLDYLWFLGYELDDPIPHHSVLSKARRRWGPEVFERFFVRTVGQCVAAGLVDGRKIHVDASLNDAHASRDSVAKASPELIAALKAAYQATENKLEEVATAPLVGAINDRVISTTDPDAAVVRHGPETARARYHHHRAVDDAHGVITAVETTPGNIAENHRLLPLMDQHQAHTAVGVKTVVADHKYGTAENFVACQQRGVTTHMGDLRGKLNNHRAEGIFPDTEFRYDATTDTYRCPAGQRMRPRRLHPKRRTWEYHLPKAVCAACALRAQCTRAKNGRTIHRHEHQALLDRARAQTHSEAARRDRRRRQHLAEGSFADAANNHGFKRARWRRLWRVRIQDWLIAGIQNVKILLKNRVKPAHSDATAMSVSVWTLAAAVSDFAGRCVRLLKIVRTISLPRFAFWPHWTPFPCISLSQTNYPIWATRPLQMTNKD